MNYVECSKHVHLFVQLCSFYGRTGFIFFQSGRSRILPDLEWQIQPEPDFQIDCNFTNLMCKNITNVQVIWVFDHFLCSSYCYIIYLHSRSNLCHSNVSSTYYISKKYQNNLTFNIPKIDFSNPAKLSGSGVIFAGAGFLLDLEKCQIPSGAEAGSEIWYSPITYRRSWMLLLVLDVWTKPTWCPPLIVPQWISSRWHLLIFTVSGVRDSGPAYFEDVCTLVVKVSGQSILHSAVHSDMFVLWTRTKFGRRRFHVAAPTVWDAYLHLLSPITYSPSLSLYLPKTAQSWTGDTCLQLNIHGLLLRSFVLTAYWLMYGTY